jgi:hypothetical protein
MENVCIFYYHLTYFTAIWYNLWPFGLVCGHLVYFPHFGMFGPRKIWQPWFGPPFFTFGSISETFGLLHSLKKFWQNFGLGYSLGQCLS